MSETVSTTSQTRSRLLKGGGAILGIAAIGAAITLTASQWTDDATVQGDVSVGSFEITVGPEALDFVEFAPGPTAEQTSTHVITNASTTEATLELTEETFPEEFSVLVTAGETNLSEGTTITLAPDETVDVDIAFELTDEDTQGVDGPAQFVFTGTQVIDDSDAGNGEEGGN